MLMIRRHVMDLIDKGAFTKAIGIAAEYARRNPGCAVSHLLVAMAEEAAGYTKAAIQTVSHAIGLAPHDPAARIMRARLYLRDKRLGEAIDDVDAVIATGDARFVRGAIACREELMARKVCVPSRSVCQGSVAA